MPLHLLGKKSWNVYSAANIARVRADEADARAREEAAEQRMQEEDAARRMALLRGEDVPIPADSVGDGTRQEGGSKGRDGDWDGRPWKKRRMRGEDETDMEMRCARTDVGSEKVRSVVLREKERDAPLRDHMGHIQLIPAPDERDIRKAEKNAEVEAEKAKKRKKEEERENMRFSDAAGYSHGSGRPWYADGNQEVKPQDDRESLALVEGKDVWGNEDPRRVQRESQRITSNDPFAAMQAAQKQLRQSERDKDSWKRKQDADLAAMKEEQRRRRDRRRQNRASDDHDSLEDFSLDVPDRNDKRESSRHARERSGHRDRRHHRHERHRSSSHRHHSSHARSEPRPDK